MASLQELESVVVSIFVHFVSSFSSGMISFQIFFQRQWSLFLCLVEWSLLSLAVWLMVACGFVPFNLIHSVVTIVVAVWLSISLWSWYHMDLGRHLLYCLLSPFLVGYRCLHFANEDGSEAEAPGIHAICCCHHSHCFETETATFIVQLFGTSPGSCRCWCRAFVLFLAVPQCKNKDEQRRLAHQHNASHKFNKQATSKPSQTKQASSTQETNFSKWQPRRKRPVLLPSKWWKQWNS